jgi:hypothetical protein
MMSKKMYAGNAIQILSILYESMAIEIDNGVKQKTFNQA